MSSSIQITGLTASSKTPGAVGQMRRARGKSNPDAAAKVLVVLGNKTSAGSLVLDAKPVQVFSEEEAVAAGGARGEVTQMALAALAYGIAPFMGAVTEASGGAAGTWTLTFTTNAGAAGTFFLLVGHVDYGVLSIPINIPAGSTPTASAVIAKTAINTAALGRLAYTADNSSGVLTITSANVGVRANQHIAHLDNTTAPPTLQTAALTGGTALSDGGIPMTGGSGQDTLTAILANMLADQYEYQATAANDATSVDAALDQIDAKDHPLVGMTEFLVVGLNGTQAAAITFGSSSMNHALGELVFLKSCMTHPSVIAASMAAKRATTEGTNRNHRYNGEELLGVAPHFSTADIPGRSATDAMLDAGVTPLTTKNGKAVIVRAITTYCLNGSAPDYRCLDVSNSVVAQGCRRDLVSYWDNTYSVANPYVGPDDPEGLPPPPGVATPKYWNSEVLNYMQGQEVANNVAYVDDNPPVSEWDDTAKRIMTRVKSIAKPQNHQQGILVDQTSA